MPPKLGLALITATLLLTHAAIGWSAPRDSRERTLTVTPVRPYQPGDIVWYSSPPAPDGFGPDSTCERVPSTGYIGQGVFASSGSHFSSSWSWGGGSSGQAFTWYIKLSNEATADWGTSSGGGDSRTLSANTYHWKVQNNGGTPQAWTVCYS